MFCTKCGKEITEPGRFCTSCGAPLGAPAPAQQPVQQPVQQPAPNGVLYEGASSWNQGGFMYSACYMIITTEQITIFKNKRARDKNQPLATIPEGKLDEFHKNSRKIQKQDRKAKKRNKR